MKTREQKREEAQARQKARKARTPDEQLDILRSRGITAGGEWERLVGLIDNGQGKLKEEE